jgi:hypothetical protein
MKSLPMPLLSIANGAALMALSVIGYVLKDPANSGRTALIPGAFGVLLVLCGVLALRESLRKHAMHVASAVALLGTVGRGSFPIVMSLVNGTFGARGRWRWALQNRHAAVLRARCLPLCIKLISCRRGGSRAQEACRMTALPAGGWAGWMPARWGISRPVWGQRRPGGSMRAALVQFDAWLREQGKGWLGMPHRKDVQRAFCQFLLARVSPADGLASG